MQEIGVREENGGHSWLTVPSESNRVYKVKGMDVIKAATSLLGGRCGWNWGFRV